MSDNSFSLVQVLGQYRWNYVLSLLFLIIAILAQSLEPKILQLTVDSIVAHTSGDDHQVIEEQDWVSQQMYRLLAKPGEISIEMLLLGLGLLYIGISFIRGGLWFASAAIKVYVAEKIVQGLRDTVFKVIQSLPLDFFSEMPKGELIQRSTGDVDTIKRFVEDDIINLVRTTCLFLFALLMMILSNWQYALISMALVPVIGVIAYFFFQWEGKIWKEHEAEADKLNDMIQENLNGIRVVKAFANEQHEQDKFDQQNQKKLAIGVKHEFLHVMYWPLTEALTYIQIALNALIGGYFVLNQYVTIGEFMSYQMYVGMMAWPMRHIGETLSHTGMALVALERVSKILHAPAESDEGQKEASHFQGHITFNQVSFKYKKDAEQYALQDVSFQIKPGEKIAIIGPTGAGKSTLTKLLLRFYEPNQGDILIDGVNIRNYTKKTLRERIGMSLQKAFLFSTTLKENIAYTQAQAESPQVDDAARVAQAYQMKQKFPEGFETLVGEKGVTLSGGQKQRVALARTVLPEPDILILDDTTSAVDTATERAIFQALADKTRKITTIIISHRVTSIKQADRIFVMDQGRIVREGSHKSLLKEDPYYQKIHEIQATLEQEIVNVQS